MDRFRICVCYLITTFLISVFVYSLIYSNVQSMRKLERLREDVDEMAHLVLHAPFNSKTEPKHITELIDNLIKKRLAGIWDDLYSIKKQIKGRDCASITSGASKSNRNEGALVKTDERVNYAAEELGAKIANVRADPICPTNILKSLLGMDFSTNPPIHMLRTNMEPGSCFGYSSREAEVTIKLTNEVFIDQIALQHITKKRSPTEDTSSAPKDFQVVGLNNDREYPLGKFKFDNNPNKPVQNFNIRSNDRLKYLRFHFSSNHGHPNYTCIYRIAVYGKL